MKAKIVWTKQGVQNWTILQADTLRELQKKVNYEIERLQPVDNYSSEFFGEG